MICTPGASGAHVSVSESLSLTVRLSELGVVSLGTALIKEGKKNSRF